jgi:hypothetical protein
MLELLEFVVRILLTVAVINLIIIILPWIVVWLFKWLFSKIFVKRRIAENLNQFRPLRKSDTPFPSFTKLLTYIRGDKRLKNSYRYVDSIAIRISVVGVCLEEFLERIPRYEEEQRVLHQEGHVQAIQTSILVVKYETYLNAIYSLMENLAYIVHRIHKRHPLPQRFHRQKDKLLNDRTIDPDYSAILDETAWYDEVRAMRAEFTHFLSGMIIHYEPGVPGYLNLPKSERKATPERIEIPDMIAHAKSIYDSILHFLERFGRHFLNLIDKDARVLHTCGITYGGAIGCRMLSYNEEISGKPGICHTYRFDCPKAKGCPARQNTDLDTGKAKRS